MLKTSVKFLRWFGVVLLIFCLMSLRHVIPDAYAVGYPCIGPDVSVSTTLQSDTSGLIHGISYSIYAWNYMPKDTRPEISNITTNQHKNFTEVFNIFNCFTVL
jgi:hypothetical protein